jgi:hypothetical protein
VSTVGRHISHIIHHLHLALDASVHVILNPVERLEGTPLNAFYTYAAPEGLVSSTPPSTTAQLHSVPGNRVLTMSIEVPEAWLVEVMLLSFTLMVLRCEHSSQAAHTSIN